MLKGKCIEDDTIQAELTVSIGLASPYIDRFVRKTDVGFSESLIEKD